MARVLIFVNFQTDSLYIAIEAIITNRMSRITNFLLEAILVNWSRKHITNNAIAAIVIYIN